MATLTLLDLAKRSGSDPMVGLIEEVLTVAPELRTIPTVPKAGTSYKITQRTAVGKGSFRHVNEGIAPTKSTYKQIDVPMFFFDGQMTVDEAIVKADDRRLGDILADEGAGQLQGSYIALGDQIYRGVTADAKGFAGFKASVASDMVIDATGTGSATHTAWAIYENTRDGVCLPVGNNGLLQLGQWTKQQVNDASSNPYMAWVNNLSFYIGLGLHSAKCIGCVKNITSAKPLTDALGAELVSKFPVGRKPTRWMISRDSAFYLQKSRTAIGQVATDGKGGQGFSPRPTELAGVPIVETDSIATLTAW